MDIEKIYRDYFTVVYKYILFISHDPLVAEEITQEPFFKAMKRIDSFRGDSSIRVWLCQIVKSKYIMDMSEENIMELKDSSTLIREKK